MSNREYRNRLDRATQIRCSVRWEGEEGTGGQPWAPCIALHTPNLHCAPCTQLALRPIHPTCIAPIHPGVYIQRKTNIFTGYFSKQQLQMGMLLNFVETYHVGQGGSSFCWFVAKHLLISSGWQSEALSLNWERIEKKKREESESKKASEYDIWVIAIGWTRVKAVWAVPIIQDQR